MRLTRVSPCSLRIRVSATRALMARATPWAPAHRAMPQSQPQPAALSPPIRPSVISNSRSSFMLTNHDMCVCMYTRVNTILHIPTTVILPLLCCTFHSSFIIVDLFSCLFGAQWKALLCLPSPFLRFYEPMILRERIVYILQSKYTVYDRFRWKLDTLPKQVSTGGGGLGAFWRMAGMRPCSKSYRPVLGPVGT